MAHDLQHTAPAADGIDHTAVVVESAAPAARAEQSATSSPAEKPAAGLAAQPPAVALEHKTLALALLAAQRDAKEIVKDARNEGGPNQQAYDYATLPNVYAQARSVINAHGLILSHHGRMRDVAGAGMYVMETRITHAKSGKSEVCEFPICKGFLPPRQTGELMTYAQRYNTLAILALAPKERDTDGDGVGSTASPKRDGPTAALPAPSSAARERLMLIDASGLIYRAYHACPALVRESDGQPVGAVLGFVGMLSKLLSDAPERVAVVFDAGKRTFRHALFADYKANRPPTPDDLSRQMPLFRDAARAMGLAVVETAGFEADDILATYARAAASDGAHVTVVSADKDLMQLVSERIALYDPKAERFIDRQAVIDKLGVGPERAIDAQALIGDTADNVPGAPGIGAVWASELLGKFGTVEAMIARADEIDGSKRDVIVTHAAQIMLSKRLVALATDVPMATPWQSLTRADADVSAFIEGLGPHAEASAAPSPPPPSEGEAREEGDAKFYTSMLQHLSRCHTAPEFDAWLAMCTMDALKKCTKAQRDSLRSEHERQRAQKLGAAMAGGV